MGLFKAAKDAIGGTLADQWKEAIRCDDMTNDVLMVKKTTPNGVISNKSTIIVAPGQCAVIFDKLLMQQQKKGFINLIVQHLRLFLQEILAKLLRKCGRDSHTMEQRQSNKQYFSLIQKKY